MSLAMSAAPFNDESEPIYNEKKNHKSSNHTKTQRRSHSIQENYENVNSSQQQPSEKAISVLKTIQNLPPSDDDLADFNPLPPPSSVGGQRRQEKDNHHEHTPVSMQSKYSLLPNAQHSSSSSSNSNSNSNVREPFSHYIDSNMVSDEYKRFIPNYQEYYNKNGHGHKGYHQTNQYSSGNDILIEKLNYMIHLLEENQDEKTNNVTEEVVLYSFLGIFIIFIVDSFVRVGKYTR